MKNLDTYDSNHFLQFCLYELRSLIQNTTIPSCSNGERPLWVGWSYLASMADEDLMPQDLGKSMSCLQRFTQIPFIRCGEGDSNEVRN